MKPQPDRFFVEGVVVNHSLFRKTQPEHLAALTRHSTALSARRGDLVARQGDRAPGLFIVGYGLAKLTLGRPGKHRVLRLVGSGQIFGAASAILGRACPFDAIAVRDSRLAVVPASAVLALLEREPGFGRTLATLLAERSLELLAEVDSSLQGGAQRLAGYLVSLAVNGEPAVRLPVTKTLVAARLGMKKETLSRLLARFAAERLIEVVRQDVVLLDRERLRRLGSAG